MAFKCIFATLLAAIFSGHAIAGTDSAALSTTSSASNATTKCQGNTDHCVSCGVNQLEVYPLPTGMSKINSFSVDVKSSSGHPKSVDTYLATLSEVNTTSGAGIIHNTSVAYFDFCGSVEVSITYGKGNINSAAIRPYSLGIVPQIRGNTLVFTLTQPRNVVIQVNDEIFDALHLFSNPIESDIPNPESPDVWYFGPGVNNGTAYKNATNGVLLVPSGKTVYIAGGGVLTAQLSFTNVSNAVLRGRGVLHNNPGGAVLVQNATNITIEDVIMINPNGYAVLAGEASHLSIRGIRAFSSKGNGDGIDLFCCQDSVIDGVFMRNSDDTIAIYQHRWNYYGDSHNITVRNSALWADVAHPINIGTHGNSENPETMDGVTITNIDILDHREPQMWYQGCIAINAGDSNLIQNVHVEDVRVENFRLGQLVNLHVMYNSKYNTSPGRGIKNVYIKDLAYNGTNASPSLLFGYDEDRTISNVTFESLHINGELIADTMQKPTWYYTADFVPMFANEHVLNLTFKAAA